MTDPEPPDVHRPRTIDPGHTPGSGPVVRPRTIPALGAPEAVAPPEPRLAPPLESFSDLTWQPPTGQVPAVEAPTPPVPKPEPEEAAEPESAAVEDTEPAEAPAPVEPDEAAALQPDAAAVPVSAGVVSDIWTNVHDEAPFEERAPEEATASTAGAVASATAARSGLLRANLLVASGTAVSRLTGLVRTALIATLLFKTLADAYLGANNTPNMIYELILGGVLTASLVPLFTDDLEKGDGNDATSAIISFALVALLVVTAVALIGGPLLILLFSTGSSAANRDDYVSVGIPLALMFAPQVFFYGLMAVWSAVLNARHRFMAAAWAPVLNNVIAIATLLFAASLTDGAPDLQDVIDDRRILWVLGGGTTMGIAVMALSLYPAIRRSGLRMRFKLRMKHPAVRRAIRLSGWTFGYVIANQIAVIVIQILAKPASGDVTAYQTSFQFFQLPHALLAVSIMVTFEPLLGRADARGDRTGFNTQLLLGFRLIGLLIIPAAIGYIALPKGLDSITFVATGNLDKALQYGSIIAAFAVGLPGFSTYLYALRGFYAMKNTRLPFIINCGENAINIVAAIIFVRWWGVVGLALAFALAYSVSAVIAVIALNRHSPGFDWRGLIQTWAKLLAAALIMGGFVYGVVSLIAPSSAVLLIPTLAAGIGVGAITYFAAIYALQVPGINELMVRLPGLRRFA